MNNSKKNLEECYKAIQIQRSASFTVKEKLKKLKEKLKWWNHGVFGILDINSDKLVGEMNELEEITANGGSIDVNQVKSLSAKFWKQLKYIESLLAQKTRAKWIVEDDASTRYFHRCMKNNRRRNQITKLKNGDQWVEEVTSVKHVDKGIL